MEYIVNTSKIVMLCIVGEQIIKETTFPLDNGSENKYFGCFHVFLPPARTGAAISQN